MKEKLIIGASLLMTAFHALAVPPTLNDCIGTTPCATVPEPSTLGLFAAAAIAVAVVARVKK